MEESDPTAEDEKSTEVGDWIVIKGGWKEFLIQNNWKICVANEAQNQLCWLYKGWKQQNKQSPGGGGGGGRKNEGNFDEEYWRKGLNHEPKLHEKLRGWGDWVVLFLVIICPFSLQQVKLDEEEQSAEDDEGDEDEEDEDY